MLKSPKLTDLIMSEKKSPSVCLLNPCFCSITNVLYKDQGRPVTKLIPYQLGL